MDPRFSDDVPPVCIEGGLVLQQDASYDCTEYDCESCDDSSVCDSVRDLVELRRSKTAEAGASTG